jgi:hypothetical protein
MKIGCAQEKTFRGEILVVQHATKRIESGPPSHKPRRPNCRAMKTPPCRLVTRSRFAAVDMWSWGGLQWAIKEEGLQMSRLQ